MSGTSYTQWHTSRKRNGNASGSQPNPLRGFARNPVSVPLGAAILGSNGPTHR